MALKYSTKVIEHFTQPQNVGEIPDADAMATEGSPACGDMITYTLKINPETKVVEDVRFRSFGCASNIATASMTTLLAKGKTINEIKKLKHRDITQALDGLPAVKMHCSVLAIDALKSAVHKWEIDHGMIEDKIYKLDYDGVLESLKNCLNPRTGISIVENRLINKLEVEPEAGSVFIELKLCEMDEMYVEAIEEEIREKVQAIPGVKIVLVQFKACEHSG
ncbi:MAG: iron-sulfur cluster assembly scaffold protein [Candidatus Hatepunaea meridiana]|nr:iron-sulfur cluster assembly scaffold protein [Candidatus Hatepunaea meridiana]